MPKKLPEIEVIVDTREQNPWEFSEEEKRPGVVRISGSVRECLDAGDYSIKGLEDKVRIEKKTGFCELFGNMTPSANKQRFEREMEKLSKIPHAYILIETNLGNDILGLSIPQMSRGVPARTVYKWLIELSVKYGVNVMFVGECGRSTCKNILRQVARKYLYA